MLHREYKKSIIIVNKRWASNRGKKEMIEKLASKKSWQPAMRPQDGGILRLRAGCPPSKGAAVLNKILTSLWEGGPGISRQFDAIAKSNNNLWQVVPIL
jgi:hypothetical protein